MQKLFFYHGELYKTICARIYKKMYKYAAIRLFNYAKNKHSVFAVLI